MSKCALGSIGNIHQTPPRHYSASLTDVPFLSLFPTVCFTKEVNVIDARIFEVAQSRPTGCRTPAERCQVGQEAGA